MSGLFSGVRKKASVGIKVASNQLKLQDAINMLKQQVKSQPEAPSYRTKQELLQEQQHFPVKQQILKEEDEDQQMKRQESQDDNQYDKMRMQLQYELQSQFTASQTQLIANYENKIRQQYQEKQYLQKANRQQLQELQKMRDQHLQQINRLQQKNVQLQNVYKQQRGSYEDLERAMNQMRSNNLTIHNIQAQYENKYNHAIAQRQQQIKHMTQNKDNQINSLRKDIESLRKQLIGSHAKIAVGQNQLNTIRQLQQTIFLLEKQIKQKQYRNQEYINTMDVQNRNNYAQIQNKYFEVRNQLEAMTRKSQLQKESYAKHLSEKMRQIEILSKAKVETTALPIDDIQKNSLPINKSTVNFNIGNERDEFYKFAQTQFQNIQRNKDFISLTIKKAILSHFQAIKNIFLQTKQQKDLYLKIQATLVLEGIHVGMQEFFKNPLNAIKQSSSRSKKFSTYLQTVKNLSVLIEKYIYADHRIFPKQALQYESSFGKYKSIYIPFKVSKQYLKIQDSRFSVVADYGGSLKSFEQMMHLTKFQVQYLIFTIVTYCIKQNVMVSPSQVRYQLFQNFLRKTS